MVDGQTDRASYSVTELRLKKWRTKEMRFFHETGFQDKSRYKSLFEQCLISYLYRFCAKKEKSKGVKLGSSHYKTETDHWNLHQPTFLDASSYLYKQMRAEWLWERAYKLIRIEGRLKTNILSEVLSCKGTSLAPSDAQSYALPREREIFWLIVIAQILRI